MLLSMTGFGKAEAEVSGKNLIVMLKSVNSKSADVSVKIPFSFREKESEIRSRLINELVRGKIDLMVNFESKGNEHAFEVNTAVLNEYFSALKLAAADKKIDDAGLFAIATRFPNVVSQNREEFDPAEWEKIEKGISSAIAGFNEFRIREGEVLFSELKLRISTIIALQEKIRPLEKERLEKIRQKLDEQLSQLNIEDNINRDRFEQEMIYYIERLDLTEEQVRLSAHLGYFIETMNQPESQGRKLSFISQEIGREINTIGSKANHAGIQKLVVEMKDELEKIKEQLFNVL